MTAEERKALLAAFRAKHRFRQQNQELRQRLATKTKQAKDAQQRSMKLKEENRNLKALLRHAIKDLSRK